MARPPGTRHRPGPSGDRHGVAAVACCVVPARRPLPVVQSGGSTAPSVWLRPAILPPWTRSGSTRSWQWRYRSRHRVRA